MKELKDFLENIRKYSPKIGEMAMRHAAQKLNVDPTLLASGGHEAKKRQVIAPQPNPFTGNLKYPAIEIYLKIRLPKI